MKWSAFKVAIATAFIAIFISCSDDSQSIISLDISVLNVSATANSYNINVSSNCNWNVSSYGDNWVSVTRDGNTMIISVADNTTYSERTTTVSVRSEDNTSQATLTITQEENKGLLSNGDNTITVSGDGATFSLSIQTNISDVTITTPDWIEETGTRTLESMTFAFTAAKNETDKERTGTISFKGDSCTVNYTVKQTLRTIYPESISFKEGSEITLTTISPYTLTPVFYPENTNVTELEWSSDWDSYLSVDNNGKLTINSSLNIFYPVAISITATSPSTGVSASIDVTVKVKATEFWILDSNGVNVRNIELLRGDMEELTPNVYPECSFRDYLYQSNDSSIVIAWNGGCTAMHEGETTITVTEQYSGLSASANVKVSDYQANVGIETLESTSKGILASFGLILSTNKPYKISVINAELVNEYGFGVGSVDNWDTEIKVENNSTNNVKITTAVVNLTELVGATYVGKSYLLRFHVIMNFNDEYQSSFYVDINTWDYLTE